MIRSEDVSFGTLETNGKLFIEVETASCAVIVSGTRKTVIA